jgi:hypothetical protein
MVSRPIQPKHDKRIATGDSAHPKWVILLLLRCRGVRFCRRTRDAIDSVLGTSLLRIYCVPTAYWKARDELNTLVNMTGRASWPVSRILFRVTR